MSIARPQASEERWLALAAGHRALRTAALQPERSGGWKCATLLSRCLFFALGLVAASMSYAVFNLLHLPAWEILCGLALIVVAELMIRQRRMFASGIEESLWAAGAVGLALKLWDALPAMHNDTSGLLLLAAAILVAGWRLLNPLFITGGAITLSWALAHMIGRPWRGDGSLTASALCFALAFFALALGARTWLRPAHERMLAWLVVVMPGIGYLWTLWGRNSSFTLAMLREPHVETLSPLLLPLVFGGFALVTGLRRRTHAPLIAALVCVLCLAVELRAVTGLTLQWRLIVWGTMGLLAAIAIERWLRTPHDGITSRDLEEPGSAAGLIALAGAAALVPPAASPPAQPGVHGQGGEFGGGGASGRF